MRAVWWRRGLSAAVLLVATVTTGAAALGPLYARAAGESTLRDELTQHAGADTGLRFTDLPHGAYLSDSIAHFDRLQAGVPRAGAIPGYPVRIPTINVFGGAQTPSGAGVQTALVWRPGACRHLRIVHGHCPTGAGQALASQRTVDTRNYRWGIGKVVSTSGAKVRIVGTYVPRDPTDAFWFGGTYFDASPGYGKVPDIVDAVFVTRGEFKRIPPSTQAVMTWDFPLDPRAIRLDDVPRLRQDVAALTAAVRAKNRPNDYLQVTSKLDHVLDAADHQRHLINVGTLLVTLQLTLLAWLVLFQVIADAVESRGNEIALAKLRGFRPRATVRFTLSEPLVLLTLALPLGLLLAWIAAHLIGDAVLRPGTPIVLTWYTPAALLAGFVGGTLAAAGASYRAITRTVLAQWRRTTRTHQSRMALTLDVLVSLAAVAGLFALRATHRAGAGNDTVALLAPGLLVIAVALLGTRLLPVLTKSVLRPTRASERLGLFLAARQVVRRPAGLRLAALLAVAIGLATFAVAGEAVAAVNRTHRAQAEVGAARTIAMQYQQGVDPVAAVQRADPSGQWAMATATWLPDGGDSVLGTVLAVDSRRLPTVGYPVEGGPSTAELARLIGTAPAARIVLRGRSIRIRARITASNLRGAPAQLEYSLVTPGGYLIADAPSLRTGTHDYPATLHCPSGCTFAGLVFDRSVTFNGTMSGDVLIRSLAVDDGSGWTALAAGLTRPNAWRAGPEYSYSSDTPRPTPAGLRDHYRSESGYGGLTYAYTPSPLPVVATPAAVSPAAPDPPRMIDNADVTATFRVVRQTAVLPVVLTNGMLVDLTFIRRELPGFDAQAHWSIWLGPHAPADAVAKLRAAGLTLENGSTTHARIVQLARQGPALSLFLLLACAIIGAIVAVGGTAVAISASARRRTFETAALRAVGVRGGALYRAGVIEQLMLLGSAVVLGVPAGTIAARLAMPVIPEFADATPVPLRYLPPWPPVVGFVVGFVVLVSATAVIAARGVLRAAKPSRLREAEE